MKKCIYQVPTSSLCTLHVIQYISHAPVDMHDVRGQDNSQVASVHLVVSRLVSQTRQQPHGEAKRAQVFNGKQQAQEQQCIHLNKISDDMIHLCNTKSKTKSKTTYTLTWSKLQIKRKEEEISTACDAHTHTLTQAEIHVKQQYKNLLRSSDTFL